MNEQRPRQVTVAGWLIIGGGVAVVLTAFEQMAALHSLATREMLERMVSEPPLDGTGVGVGDLTTVVHVLTLIAAGCATAIVGLGWHAMTGSRLARLILTVLAGPLLVAGLSGGGLFSTLVAVAALLLWLPPAREWFNGEPLPTAGRGDDVRPPAMPPSAPRSMPSAPPSAPAWPQAPQAPQGSPHAPPPGPHQGPWTMPPTTPPVPPAWPRPTLPPGQVTSPVPAARPGHPAQPGHPVQPGHASHPGQQWPPSSGWPPPAYWTAAQAGWTAPRPVLPRPARRPGAVIRAAVLTWVFSALSVLMLALALVYVLNDHDALWRMASERNADLASEGVTRGGLVTVACVVIVLAALWSIACVIVAAFVWRGAPWARVTLLVLVAVSLAGVALASLTNPLFAPAAVAAVVVVVALAGADARAWCAPRR